MRLANGVALDGTDVVDRVRGLRLPANDAALAILRGEREVEPEFHERMRRHLLADGDVLRGPVRTGVLRAVLPVATALTLLALPFALAVRAWPLAVALGAGVLLHEVAHAAALAGLPRAGVRRGLRAAVLHPRLTPARALVVGVAGPLAPALAALLVARLPTAALPLVAHALALTVVSPDGRNACGLS